MQRWLAAFGGVLVIGATLGSAPGCSSDAEGEASSCPDGVGCAGAACTGDDECASGKCNAGVCAAPPGVTSGEPPPSATDGKRNETETDVDCGGATAPPCDDGKACAADTDCKTGWCAPDKKLCVPPTTDDNVQNGTETDVDCGGTSGVKCAEPKKCVVDGDCTGACRFDNTCVDAPSCKPKLGGVTCGAGEVTVAGVPAQGHESCCKTLEVKGFTDPAVAGKKVYLDKYEITAGRIRAFVEYLAANHGGSLKAYVAANQPRIWDASWNQWLATSATGDSISVPHKPTSGAEAAPWFRNVGTNFTFNQQLFVYVHGHNCGNSAGSYGFPTFFYPKDVQLANGSLERAVAFDGNGGTFQPKDYLDAKAATCIPNYFLTAFCNWDGGQLATDEVLDFVTSTTSTNPMTCTKCATSGINVTSDSGQDTNIPYRFPYFADSATGEGAFRIAGPGRMPADVVRQSPADEPWMDLAGNLNEVVLDVTGATFTGKFALKYRGIGFSSARAGGNSASGNLSYPEYRAGYSGGRCMRYK